MTNEVTRGSFNLSPSTFEQAIKFSEMIAKSTMVPKYYQGKSGDILIAVQMGAELGLKPIQSLQNIAVINGKPAIYGDALLALVKAHPDLEDHQEYMENDTSAVCKIKRKGQTEHVVIFNIDDAKKANLWGKAGPWSQYPKRMLMMRARGFALRNTFPDALAGLITREEAEDIPQEIKEVYREVEEIKHVEETKATYTFDDTEYEPNALTDLLKSLVGNVETEDAYADVAVILKRNSKELARFKETYFEDGEDISHLYKQKTEIFRVAKP